MVSQEKTAQVVYDLGTYSLIAYLVASFIVLVIASIIVADIKFPRKHPWKFTIETLLMAFIATFPFMFIVWSRTGTLIVSDLLDYAILIFKFAGFHLLLQFSGLYTIMFNTSGLTLL